MDKNMNSTGPHVEYAERQVRKYIQRFEQGLPLWDEAQEESHAVPTEHVAGTRQHISRYMQGLEGE